MDVGVAVGVGVGVRLGVGLGVGMGISLLGLTWNRPTVTIDFFSVDKETRIFFYHNVDMLEKQDDQKLDFHIF